MSTDQRKGVYVDGDGRPLYWGREHDYSGSGTFLNGWVRQQVQHFPEKGMFKLWDFNINAWVTDTVKEQEWNDLKQDVVDTKTFRRDNVDALLSNLGNSATIRDDLDLVVLTLDSMVKPV
jgi:hypothetical protein